MLLGLLVLINAYQAQVSVAFSPQGGCKDTIITHIDEAQTRILAAVYSFTSESIAQALISAHERGVEVKVLIDEAQIKGTDSQAETLANAGIEVRTDSHSGYMHNKFVVIDDSVVISGSYNWSLNAEIRNDENLIVISSAEVTEAYFERFALLWKEAIDWKPEL